MLSLATIRSRLPRPVRRQRAGRLPPFRAARAETRVGACLAPQLSARRCATGMGARTAPGGCDAARRRSGSDRLTAQPRRSHSRYRKRRAAAMKAAAPARQLQPLSGALPVVIACCCGLLTSTGGCDFSNSSVAKFAKSFSNARCCRSRSRGRRSMMHSVPIHVPSDNMSGWPA